MPAQASEYAVDVIELGDEDDVTDARDSWLNKEGVCALAFKFTSLYKNTCAKFIDPDSPVADLVKDFVVGYSVVRQKEMAILVRLMTKMITRDKIE